MFTVASFIIAKIWKQPKCPSIDEWIKQLWDIYTIRFYLPIKKKKIVPFATVLMENIMLNEISQPERDKCYDLTHRWNPVSKLNKQGKWGQTPRWRADDSSWASGVG